MGRGMGRKAMFREVWGKGWLYERREKGEKT